MKNYIAGALMLSLMLTGCTQEKPYKELAKGTQGLVQVHKPVIATGVDYLYAASTVESDRKATSSRPHWMGDAKRVRFVFTEKDLKVVEPERDGRFSSNPVNNKVVLSMPISHIDYKCAEDDFGKCTHKEEVNNDVTWDKKQFFILKGEDLALQQLSFLPGEIEKFFGSPCTREVRSEFVKAEVTADHINLILEKTFQDTCPKPGDFDDAADLTFSVRYQHSFIKLDKVVSPDYKPIRYTRSDEGNFGFFSTQQITLDIDNNDVVGSEKYFFDRWNPSRKEVVYYLSAAFNKPEHALIKKATEESVAAINDAFKKAGAPTQIVLKEPVEGMSSGDIRYNMIVLEEDPQAAGVIGYGPHAANPLTGEILHAKTIMYLGTMKKYLKYNYDELVKEKQASTSSTAVQQANALKLDESLIARVSRINGAGNIREAAASRSGGRNVPTRAVNMKEIKKVAQMDKHYQAFAKDAFQKMEFMSRNCMFPGEMVHLEGDIGGGVDEVLDEVKMKPWAELTDAEKEKVIAVLLPHVWKPTLIHELGHNLGLRHNFAGSEDKANFYSAAELNAMGIKRPAAYSSVMDYAYRTNNELRVMGKYDIAALRYGYAEKVETADGQIISLAQLRANPATELKPYGFCTDEHVSANPNCNRFDEGTNLLEIAEHQVKAYHERYAKSNVRNGRRKFSLLNDSAQAGAISNMMFELRLNFERYETIKNSFDLADTAPEWESIPFLKELKAATVVSGKFFLQVMRTPDLLCAIARVNDPSSIIGLIPIREISKRDISCLDIEVNPASGLMIVAEGGKSYQSRKDPNSDNPWADQIDVRGIWMDKALAAHYLLTRELGSSLTDQYTENFLHMPEMQAEILATLDQTLKDEFAAPVEFRTVFGPSVTFEVPYKLADIVDANNSHKLPAVMDGAARALFGLPDKTTLYHQGFINQVNGLVASTTHASFSNAVLHLMRVYPALPNDGRPQEYQTVDIQPGVRLFVHKDSAMALALAQDLAVIRVIGQLTPEQQEKVLKAIADGSDAGLDPLEKASKDIGKSAIERLQQGGFQQPGYYAMILQSLAR
jgi:hypothetical protein